MITNHTHPQDCPDRKAAATDRKQHDAARAERQARYETLARAEWLEWYAGDPRK